MVLNLPENRLKLCNMLLDPRFMIPNSSSSLRKNGNQNLPTVAKFLKLDPQSMNGHCLVHFGFIRRVGKLAIQCLELLIEKELRLRFIRILFDQIGMNMQ